MRRALPRESIFNIQYEDMLDEDMRVRILERLVDFVGALTAAEVAGVGVVAGRRFGFHLQLTYAAAASHMHTCTYAGLNDDATPQERNRRVLCAFELAQDVGGGRRGSNIVKTIEADDPNPVVTTADAYARKLACAMWSVFGEAVKDTYTLPNGIAESECE